jgi:hypothetical protein
MCGGIHRGGCHVNSGLPETIFSAWRKWAKSIDIKVKKRLAKALASV